MSIPLEGQGTPLPAGFAYRGAWILEPRMFLYIEDAPLALASGPRFSVLLNTNRDDWCFGFDAAQLAAALDVTVEALFEANQARTLTLEKIEADTPGGENATMKIYTFRIGERKASITIEALRHAGSA